MKKYIITARTDGYHASRMKITGKPLKYVGCVPVKWCHDSNYEFGYTLEEARKQLDSYYQEDVDRSGSRQGLSHKHFDMAYVSDIITYSIEPIEVLHLDKN